MALHFSLAEFGGPLSAPLTNNLASPRIDAGWYVDFSQFGAEIDIDLSAIASADTFGVTAPSLSLWASQDPASVAQATLLATVSVPPTSGAFVGQDAFVTVNNPSGKGHLLLTSMQGTG